MKLLNNSSDVKLSLIEVNEWCVPSKIKAHLLNDADDDSCVKGNICLAKFLKL